MSKRTHNLLRALIMGVVLIPIVALVLMRRPPEPVYQGKPISHWIERAAAGQRLEYYDALKHIGTNALPYVIAAAASQDSLWRNAYRRRYPALPQFLQRLLPKPKAMLSPSDVPNAISYTAPDSISFAIENLEHRSPKVRAGMAWGLGAARSKWPEVNQAIPALIKATYDRDRYVRWHAAAAFRSFGTDGAPAIDALTRLVAEVGTPSEREDFYYLRNVAAAGLGAIGPQATNALPALKIAMNEPNAVLSAGAAIAIWRISGDSRVSLPPILAAMPQLETDIRWDLVKALGEMGPLAKTAVPLLIGEAQTNSHLSIRRDATNALIRVDPEAAAAAGMTAPIN